QAKENWEYASAAYYLQMARKEYAKALQLLNLSIENDPSEWYYRLKFQQLEKLGHQAEALETARAGHHNLLLNPLQDQTMQKDFLAAWEAHIDRLEEKIEE
ncbi:MAG: hypothetical protein AAFU03_14180, partial [Bacteroidota bacterium]